MASVKGNDAKKAKLRMELEYYTSLVSKHEKLQQAGKTIAVKDNKHQGFVKSFQVPLQTGNFTGYRKSPSAYTFQPKPLLSNVSNYKRTVVQNKFPNPASNLPDLFPKRLVIASSNKNKRNSPFTSSPNKINGIQQHALLYNTKQNIPNKAVNASKRSVLLPELTLNRTNSSISKPNISNSAKSTNLEKALAETQQIFMKAGSKEHIEKLKAITKQLELRKRKLALAKSKISSVKSCDVLVNSIFQSTNMSPLMKPNLNCQVKQEHILKLNTGNIVKNCLMSKSLNDEMPEIANKETVCLAKNNISTLSSLGTINVETPIAHCIMGHKSVENISNLSSSQNSEVQCRDTLLQLAKNLKFASNCPSNTPTKADVSGFSVLRNGNHKTLIDNTLIKAKCIVGNKLSISSKQIAKMSKESLTSFVNSQRPLTNSISPPTVKGITPQRLSSAKKKGLVTKLVASKYKVVNKRLSPAVSSKNRLSEASIIKAKNLLGASIETSAKLLKIQNVQSSCATMPLAASMKCQKVNSIMKQGNMTKLIASKFKVVNKKIQNSPAVSGKNRFSKNPQEATPNSFSTWYPPTTLKTPMLKKLHSNYKVVNLVKTPKMPTNNVLKSPSPRFMKKGKYSLKRRKMDTSISATAQNLKNIRNPILLKSHFKHTKVNHLAGTNFKKSTKLNLSMKSSSCALKSKYKVINRRGSSKKSPKSSGPKPGAVLRTKSGVDIDLLRELAAERESAEIERIDALKKKSVLLKRVYVSKNAIVNKNVSSVTGAKMAKMIKAKYLLNKNVWPKHATSKKFLGNKYFKGHRFIAGLQRTPTAKFCNPKIKRNCFKFPVSSQKHKHLRSYKASPHYAKTNKRRYTYRNEHLRTLQNHPNSTPISKVLANRVLHQSINRVITASAKKKLSKVNTYCMFYNRFGRCNKGLKCTYVHDPSKIAVCTRFLRGTCKNDNCLFSHEITPGKMAICSFFLLGSCTKTDCPYRHETLLPNAVLCKAFVQGYCPDGRQCKKAHVLVCPHFIQGFCEKGDTCAFPHPPPKEKKMLPKPNDKKEPPMDVEDLMERVSRYFQPSNEQVVVLETNKTTVVPRRQKLPEQPSYIAL